MMDKDIVMETEKIECYCPVVEYISIEDSVLCTAVEQIEEE